MVKKTRTQRLAPKGFDRGVARGYSSLRIIFFPQFLHRDGPMSAASQCCALNPILSSSTKFLRVGVDCQLCESGLTRPAN